MLGALNKYKLLAILAVAILAIAIPVTIIQVQKQQETRQRAATSAVSLQFAPNTITKSINDSFNMDINLINTDSPKDISAVDITINYNSSILEFSSFQPGQGFDPIINTSSQNSIHYVATVPTGSSMNGSAIRIGSLTFKGKSAGTGSVTFGNILVTASGVSDALAIDSGNNNVGAYTITSGTAVAPTQPAAIRYNQQCITDLINSNCGEQPTSDCSQQYSNASSCIVRTPTPIPGATSGYSSCTANGNWCSGATPVGKGNCAQVSGSCNNPSFEFCWNCDVKAPTPGQTSPVSGGTYRAGDGQQSGAAPTYSPGSTSIPPGQLIALNFRGVTLPGISPDVGSADLKLTFFRGDNTASLQQIPGGPFTANIARSQAKDTFSGRVVFPASALQLPTSSLQVYFIQISVGSYQAKISGDDGTKARTIAEIQSQQLSGLIPINIFTDGKDSVIPAVKLLSGDINGDGFIDGADLGIIVACFGKKNVLTDSAGRTTDCSSKTQNRKFDVDIDKNRSVDGIDINLWSRGANGII